MQSPSVKKVRKFSRVKIGSSFLKIGQAAQALGVSIDTLRRWERAGKISTIRTPGGTRLYHISALKEINPAIIQIEAVEPNQSGSLSTEELLKRTEDQTVDDGKWKIGTEDREWKIDNQSSTFHPQKSILDPLPSIVKKSLLTKFLIGSAFLSAFTLLLTGSIVLAYFTQPKETEQVFKNNIASGLLFPFHELAEVTVAVVAPVKAKEWGFSKPEPPPPVAYRLLPVASSNVLAETASSPYLEINGDTLINGSLSVRDSINGLILEATASAGTMAFTAGETSLTITKTAKLDQDVSTAASPTFNTLNLSATKDQLVFQSGGPTGTLTWTPTAARTITLPDATTTLVGIDTTQTLTNKSISGSTNTLTNIPASALTDAKVTVTAGTNLTGGGEVKLGNSITIALKDSPSITGSLTVSGATTLSSTLAVTGATTLSSTLAVGGVVSLPDGTAAAPALAFTNDADTGLYRIGANKIGLITAGTATSGITIDANGNVGIGTITPAYQLETTGNVGVGKSLTVTGLTFASGGLRVNGFSDLTGNVGVGGTASVTSLLSANGSAAVTGSFCINGECKTSWTGSGNYTASNGITLSTADFQLGGQLSRATGIDIKSQNFGFLGGNVGIGTSAPSQVFQVNANASNPVVITSGGNLGIGTTSPVAGFHNSGGTLFGTLAVSDKPAGGNIGTAATTVDIYTSIALNQTTSSQTITLPNPTDATAGRIVYLSNTGTASFTFLNSAVQANTTTAALWNGTAWTLAGGGGLAPGTTNNSTLRWNTATTQWVENGNVLSTAAGTMGLNGNLGVGTTGSPDYNLKVLGTGFFSGFVGIGSSLNVSGNVGIGSSLTTTGLTYSSGGLRVNGYSDLTGNVGIGNSLTVSSAAVLDSLSVTKSISGATLGISGASSLTGNVGIGQSLTVTSGVNFSSSLNVVGNTQLSTLSTSGNTGIGGSASIIGLTFAQGGLRVNGYSDLTGNVGVGNSLTVSSAAILDSLSVTKSISGATLGISGASSLTGNVGIGNSLTVTGLTYSSGGLRVNGFSDLTGNVGIGGSLTTTGLDYASGGLRVNGFSDLTGNVGIGQSLNVSSAAILDSLSVTKSISGATLGISGASNLTGNVGIGSSLTVTSAGIFNSGLTVSAHTNLATLSTTGAANFASTGWFGGNVGIGTSATGAALQVNGGGLFGWGTAALTGPTNGLGISGNVGIGTTTANSNLSISGNAHIGSLFQGTVAPTNGLFVDGNVGIGATTSSNKLDVWGNARITGSLTVDGNFTLGGTNTGAQFLANDGTALAPGYSFTNDTDSGLWRIGNNQIALTTNGLAHSGLSVNSNGNVGIGTTNADYNFRVNGTGYFSNFVGIGSSLNVSGNVGIGNSLTVTGLTYSSGGLRVNGFSDLTGNVGIGGTATFNSLMQGLSGLTVSGSSNLQALTATNINATTLTTTGNIGIGATTSSNKLDVWGNARITGTLTVDQTSTFGGTPTFSTMNSGSVLFAGANGLLSQNTANFYWDNSTNRLGIGTSAPVQSFQVNPSGTSAVVVTSGGNVGIGTTSPSSPIHITPSLTSGTIFNMAYNPTTTLTGSLSGWSLDLNSGNVLPSNNSVTGATITLPTTTTTSGSSSLKGLVVAFGSGSGINNNSAGSLTYTAADLSMPALTQTQGTLTANGVLVTTPSSITTGGTANAINISATGVGAGALNAVNVGTITGGNGTEIAFNVAAGWDTVLKVGSTTVINGSGVTQVAGGGTGIASYNTGDLLYASGATTLTNLGIGSSGQVLAVTAGVPVWATINGSSCVNCLTNNPSSTQNLSPTGQATTGLSIRQTSTASPTNDIFNVTDSTGATKYFYVDKDGNVSSGSVSSTTITLTPTSDTTALTLVGTNVTTQSLAYFNSKNAQGTIFNIAYGSSQTLTGTLTGQAINFTNLGIGASNQSVTGEAITMPAVTNTNSSGTKTYNGLSVTTASGLNQNGAGETISNGVAVTIPPLTQTSGTITGNGLLVTTPSSITTGGAANGLNISASGIGAGTLTGINISSISAGAGSETALTIGSGWDTLISNANFFVKGDGNVGIGTSNPTRALDVVGTGNISGNVGIGASLTITGLTVANGGLNVTGLSNLTGNVGVGNSLTVNNLTYASGGLRVNGYSDLTGNVGIGGTANFNSLVYSTGSFLAANGSATTPSYSFTSSTSTGLWSPSANALSLTTNGSGTSGITITANGNVGIGITNPSGILDVGPASADAKFFSGATTSQQPYLYIYGKDSTNTLGYLRIKGVDQDGDFGEISNSAGNIWIKPAQYLVIGTGSGIYNIAGSAASPSYTFSDNDTGMFSAGSNLLGFTTGGTEKMRIDSNGNVGIGTSSPLTKLGITGNVGIGISYGWYATPVNGLAVQGNIGIGTTTANSNLSVAGSGHIGALYQGTAAPANGLFVDGNVGIGATTSSNKLDVWGNARIAGTAAIDSTLTALNGLIGYSGITAPTSGLAISGNVGIGFTSPAATLDVIGTSMLRGTAGVLGLTVTSAGNVGVGTTAPIGNLHVVGQCVAKGTRIRRRRRKKRKGVILGSGATPESDKEGSWMNEFAPSALSQDDSNWIEEDIPVEDIKPDDEALSLNDATGEWEWHSVEKTMDMGIQQVFGIKTSGGKYIKTTKNHPYLVQVKPPKIISGVFEVDISGRVEEMNKDTFIALANKEACFVIKLAAREKRILKTLHQTDHRSKFGFQVYAHLIVQLVLLSGFKVKELTIDHDYAANEADIKGIIKSAFSDSDMEISFVSVGKSSPADLAAGRAKEKLGKALTLTAKEYLNHKKGTQFALKGATEGPDRAECLQRSPTPRVPSEIYHKSISLSMGETRWVKVGQLNHGDKIATIDGWEYVIEIEELDRIQTYDLQIENTHNFLANDIVAHNTIIMNGNLGVGTTTANSNLSVAGNAHIGSLYQGTVAPTNGLFVDGNVGIGATTSSNKLDVWGNARVAGTLTVDSTSTFGGNFTLSNGQFLAPNGTASLPSYSFTNLTNAGLWTNGDGLLLTTGGSNTKGITVTGAGSVGIGTTSPSQLFQINANASNPFVVTSGGNIGIGFTNPTAKLQLNNGQLKLSIDAGRADTDSRIIIDGRGSNPVNPALFLYANTSANAPSINFYDDTGTTVYGRVMLDRTTSPVYTGTAQNDFVLGTESNTNKLHLGTNSIARLTVDTAGNIGIGTTTANSLLSVAGGAHIGSVRQGISAPTNGLFVDGNVGIGATTSSNKLDVWGNARIAGTAVIDSTLTALNGLIGYSGVTAPTSGLAISGNVGVGTTSPVGALHVVGQCVTGDTKLRRRRRRKGKGASEKGEDDWEEIPIKDIKPGDEILTLDEKTGEFVSSKVKTLMDMGIQQTYLLITDSGKTIRTTKEHPYFAREAKNTTIFGGTYQVDQSPRMEDLNRDSFVAIANRDIHFIIKITKEYKRQLYKVYLKENKIRFFGPELFARAVNTLLISGQIKPALLKIDIEYPNYEERIAQIIALNSDLSVSYHSLGHSSSSFAHWAAYRAYKGEYKAAVSIEKEEIRVKEKDRGTLRVGLGVVTLIPLNQIRNARDLTGVDYHKLGDLSSAKWLKVYDLKPGMEIATTSGWEKIVAIKEFAREQVFDIEVEGTHNFVGNDIVAHNTIIMNGNLGIGTTSPAQALELVGTMQFRPTATSGQKGCVRFDATNADLEYSNDCSTFQSFGATAGGWSDQGTYTRLTTTSANVGIGIATTPAARVHLLGQGTGTGLSFMTQNSTQTNFGLAVLDNGNVGIGVTNPSQLFQINPSGSSAFVVQSNGNVGIGFTSPAATLDVLGTSFLRGTGGTYGLAVTSAGNVGIGITAPSGVFQIGSSAANPVLFASSLTGNVGIGTTGPGAQLDVGTTIGWGGNSTGLVARFAGVDSAINQGGNVRILGTSSAAIDKGGTLTLGGMYTGTTSQVDFGEIAGRKENATNTNAAGYLAFSTRSNSLGEQQWMRITSAGNVGIGLTVNSPGLLLEVNGPAGLPASSGSTQTGVFRVSQTAGTAVMDFGSNGNGWIQTTISSNLAATSQHLLLNPRGGNVGVGLATDPANALDVSSGGIHITSGVPGATTYALYNNAGTLTFNGVALATGASLSGTTNYVAKFTGASTVGNSVMYDDGTNVGIGTASPAQLLDVAGNIKIGSNWIGNDVNAKIEPGSGLINYWNSFTINIDDDNNVSNAQFIVAHDKSTAGTGGALLVVQEDGNVGIGFTSPGVLLDVVGAAATTPTIRIRAQGSRYDADMIMDSSQLSANDDASHIRFQNSGNEKAQIATFMDGATDAMGIWFKTAATGGAETERLRITSTGNVGIGFTSPTTQLQIYNASSHASMSLKTGSTSSSPYIDFIDPTRTWEMGGNYAGDGNFYLVKGPNGIFMDPSGNVGIGTTVPMSSSFDEGKLTVGTKTLGNSGGMTVFGNRNGGSATVGGYTFANIQSTTASKAIAHIAAITPSSYDAEAGTLRFATANTAGTLTDRMTIDETGNVGIKNTSPTQTLDITGTLNVSGAVTCGSGCAAGPWVRITSPINEIIPATTGDSLGFVSGNVGIGTTNPTTKLHVVNPAATTYTSSANSGLFIAKDSAASQVASLMIGGSSYNAVVGITTTGSNLIFGFNDGATYGEKVRIQQDGNVGIGTASPGMKLDISGAAETSFTNNPRLANLVTTNSQAAGMGAGISFGGVYTGTTQTTFGYIAGVKENGTDNNYAGKLIFGTRTNGSGGADMTRMTIDSSGSVGIGTATPVSTLHVESSLPYLTLANSATDVPINTALGILNFYSNDSSANSKGGVGSIRVYSETAFNTGNVPTYMAFYTSHYSGNDGTVLGSTTERMRINGSGNVGIGTATPGYTLEVAGTLNVTGAVSCGSGCGAGSSQWTTSGSNIYYNSGNVGIGTASPGALGWGGTVLTIASSSDVNNALEFWTNTDSASDTRTPGVISWLAGTGKTRVAEMNGEIEGTSENSGVLRFKTNDAGGGITERMRISRTGNVGIGTTVPQATLVIQGNVGIGYTGVNQSIPVNGLAVFGNVGIGITTANSALTVSGGAVIGSNVNVTAPTNGLLVGGNVGIGFTSPNQALQIAAAPSAATSLANILGANGSQLSLTGSTATTLLTKLAIGMDPANNFGYLQAGQNGAASNLILEPNGGNVGIGTTNPAAALQLGSGQIFTPNGTASLPSYSFTNSSAIGLWSPASNILALTSGTPGSGQTISGLSINNSGNVGIGTTNPGQALHLVGQMELQQTAGAASQGCIKYNSSTLQLQWSNDCLAYQAFSAPAAGGWTYDSINNYVRLTTTSSNVGIGTSSPTAPLHVWGNNTNSAFFLNGNVGIGTTATQADLALGGQAALISAFDANNGGIGIFSAKTNANVYIQGQTQADVILVGNGAGANVKASQLYNTGGVTAFRSLNDSGSINKDNILVLDHSTGNVGIGISAPDRLLQVASTINITSSMASLMGVNGTQFNISGATTNAAKKLVLGIDTTDNYGVIQAGNTDGTAYNLSLQPGGGNVGIGTTSPLNFLDIVGPNGAAQIHWASVVGGRGGGYLQSDNGNDFTLTSGAFYNNSNWVAQDTTAVKIGGGAGVITFASNSSLTVGGTFTPTERMRIDANGNVGIGYINSPGAVLSINGNVGIGTSSPASARQLTLNTTTASGLTLFAFSEANVEKALIGYDTGGGSLINSSPNILKFTSAGGMIFATGAAVGPTTSNGITIDGNGSVGIGTTAPVSRLDVNGAIRAQAGGVASTGVGLNLYYTSSQGYILASEDAGTTFKTINIYGAITMNSLPAATGNGNYVCSNNGALQVTATACPSASLLSMKTNITDIGMGLNEVMQMKPIQFDWNEKYTPMNRDQRQIGFIAEDMEKINPLLAVYSDDGKHTLRSVNYEKMSSVLVRAIQQQQAQINTLVANQATSSALLSGLSVNTDGTLNAPKISADHLTLSTDVNYSTSALASLLSRPGDDQPLAGTTSSVDVLTALNSVSTAVLGVQSQEATTSDKLASLEDKVASQSGVIASVSEAISTQSSALANLQAQIASLSAQLEVTGYRQQATESGQLSGDRLQESTSSATATVAYSLQPDASLNLTPPDVLLATGSAQLANLKVTSDATVSGQLTAYNLNIQEGLKSLGQTSLGSTLIAGDLTVDGTMSITGNSLNTLNTLNIQNSPLAGPVNFFNGLVAIDKTGKLTAQEIITPSVITNKLTISNTPIASSSATLAASIGTATIPIGQTQIPITTTSLTDKSKVFLTPTSPTGGQVLAVTYQEAGSGFVVSLDHPYSQDIRFNWWIVDSQ